MYTILYLYSIHACVHCYFTNIFTYAVRCACPKNPYSPLPGHILGKNVDARLTKDNLWYSIWNYGFRFLVPLTSILTSHLVSVFNIIEEKDHIQTPAYPSTYLFC